MDSIDSKTYKSKSRQKTVNISGENKITVRTSGNRKSFVMQHGRRSFKAKYDQVQLLNKFFIPRQYVSKDIDQNDVYQIKQVFDMIDSSGNGLLTPNDIKLVLQREGFNATRQTVYDIIAQYDDQEEGGIGFKEFMKIMRSKPCQKETRDDVKRVFRKYDKKNKEDIRQVVKELREQIDQDTIVQIMKKTDSNMDGKITLDDFYNVMTRQMYYQ